jgi:hypothetical protein
MAAPKCVHDYVELRKVEPPKPPGPPHHPQLSACEYIFVGGLPDPLNSGLQGFFEWRPQSTDDDDGGIVIKPNKTQQHNPGRWHRVYNGALSVRWFGAKGDAIHDDTGAIQAAIDTATLKLVRSGNKLPYGDGNQYSGTSPSVFFPSGTYRITSTIPVHPFLSLIGERSLIFPAEYDSKSAQYTPLDGVDIFTNVGYKSTIESLIFRRGRRAISVATNNLGAVTIRISHCDFMEQQGDAVYTDDTSPSTSLHLEECYWLLSSPSARAVNTAVDECVVRNCFVNVACDEVFRVRPPVPMQTSPSRLYLQNMFGNPLNATGCWIYNEHGVVCADNCRFGGEAGGKVLVKNYAPLGDVILNTPPTGVVIKRSAVSSALKFAVECYSVPNLLVLEDNYGYTGGVWFAEADASVRRDAGSSFYAGIERNSDPIRLVVGATDISTPHSDAMLSSLGLLATEPVRRRDYLAGLDRMLTLDGNADYGIDRSIVGGTVVDGINGFGLAETTVTALVNGASFSFQYTKAIVGWSRNTYTLVAEVEPQSGPMTVTLNAANGSREFPLGVGKHIISMPFEVNPAASTDTGIGLAVNRMANGDMFRITAMRVFKGHIEVATPNTIVYDTAPPTVGLWFVSDVVHNQAPAPGGALGWICTSAGASGPAWQATHTYATGDCVTSSGHTYECVVAGNSGTVPPSHAFGVAVDGSATWLFRPAAKFRAFGGILP